MITETVRFTDLSECLKSCFEVKDAVRLQKILSHHDKDGQYDDTFIELIVGCYLRMNGLDVRCAHKIDGKTPDWSVYNTNNNLIGLIEISHLKIDQETDTKTICGTDERPLIYTYWINEKNNLRLVDKLHKKAKQYKDVVEDNDIYFMIAVFIDSKLYFFEDELEPIVTEFFMSHGFVDEILIVDEQNYFHFRFRLWSNPRKQNSDFRCNVS